MKRDGLAPNSQTSSSPDRATSPAPDCLEVSLFGPGYGEALAVHVGAGRWVLVDSCLDADGGRSPVLDYLSAIGVDPAVDVIGVVATHWHDDHIRGIAQLVEACAASTFFCPVAMSKKEFMTLTMLPIQGATRISSGIREFRRVLEIVRARKRSGVATAGPRFLGENAIVFEGADFELRALSPSAAAVERALIGISKLIPVERRSHLRVAAPDSNEASIALWLKSADNAALLGADLERSSSPDRGWQAVVSLFPVRDGKADLLKIPHHGAESAHDESMWEQLVADHPVAFLTPWIRGGEELPDEADEMRILERAPDTTLVGATPAKPERYPNAVERTLRSAARERRRAVGRMGHSRARLVEDAGVRRWHVEMLCQSASLG